MNLELISGGPQVSHALPYDKLRVGITEKKINLSKNKENWVNLNMYELMYTVDSLTQTDNDFSFVYLLNICY